MTAGLAPLLSPRVREQFCTLIHDKVGFAIGPDKDYLLQQRLLPLARKHGFDAVGPWVMALLSAPSDHDWQETAEALATHETLFFRDAVPFREMENLYWPYYMTERANRQRLRVWSAACSTGQEPYSLAMTWLQMQRAVGSGFHLEILATDLSEAVVEHARRGIYSNFDVQRGLPLHSLLAFFSQLSPIQWKINSHIQRMVEFRAHNLLHPLVGEEAFDVIFIRNVLIYFDEETKRRVLKQVMDKLAPDGVLVLGSVENPCHLVDELEKVQGSRHGYARKSASLSAKMITHQAMLMAGAQSKT